jgi:hypothetical protein
VAWTWFDPQIAAAANINVTETLMVNAAISFPASDTRSPDNFISMCSARTEIPQDNSGELDDSPDLPTVRQRSAQTPAGAEVWVTQRGA